MLGWYSEHTRQERKVGQFTANERAFRQVIIEHNLTNKLIRILVEVDPNDNYGARHVLGRWWDVDYFIA